MIFDKIENISDYFEDLPLLEKVADFVKDFNENGKADGTYKIDATRFSQWFNLTEQSLKHRK